jgi:hypothetical protein
VTKEAALLVRHAGDAVIEVTHSPILLPKRGVPINFLRKTTRMGTCRSCITECTISHVRNGRSQAPHLAQFSERKRKLATETRMPEALPKNIVTFKNRAAASGSRRTTSARGAAVPSSSASKKAAVSWTTHCQARCGEESFAEALMGTSARAWEASSYCC